MSLSRVQLFSLITAAIIVRITTLCSVYKTLANSNSRKNSKQNYRKIPKICPGAYIFQRPFLRGLFLEGLIFGGAYVRREICVSKSIGLAYSWKEIYRFCSGGAYIWRRDLTEVFFCVTSLGGLYLEGLIHCGANFRNFRGTSDAAPVSLVRWPAVNVLRSIDVHLCLEQEYLERKESAKTNSMAPILERHPVGG